KDVMPGELHLFLWKVIINHQQNNTRDTNPERDGANRFRMRFLLGKIMPFAEAEGLERAIRTIQDNLGMALKQQRQSEAGGAYIDGLPKSIQHQNMLVEHRTHKRIPTGGKLHKRIAG